MGGKKRHESFFRRNLHGLDLILRIIHHVYFLLIVEIESRYCLIKKSSCLIDILHHTYRYFLMVLYRYFHAYFCSACCNVPEIRYSIQFKSSCYYFFWVWVDKYRIVSNYKERVCCRLPILIVCKVIAIISKL